MNRQSQNRQVVGFGLRIETCLAIPGAQPAAEPGPPDLVISQAVLEKEAEIQALGPYRLTENNLDFLMPGVATYRCARDGGSIGIEAESGATEDDLLDYLVATALPALLWLRGKIVLHAAGAVLPGRNSAIAFAGASGIGKSTLLRNLLAHGASAVGDDSLALTAVTVAGLPGCTQQVLHDGRRIRVPVAQHAQRCSTPLSHLLELRPDGPARPQRCSPTEACALLLRNLHRPRVPRLSGLEPALLPRIARLAETVPAWAWNAEAAHDATPGQCIAMLDNLVQ